MNPSPTRPAFATPLLHEFLNRLAREPAVLVSVSSTAGSAPAKLAPRGLLKQWFEAGAQTSP